mgnify:CR=1 FL=1
MEQLMFLGIEIRMPHHDPKALARQKKKVRWINPSTEMLPLHYASLEAEGHLEQVRDFGYSENP